MSESPRLISLSVPHQAASTAVQVFRVTGPSKEVQQQGPTMSVVLCWSGTELPVRIFSVCVAPQRSLASPAKTASGPVSKRRQCILTSTCIGNTNKRQYPAKTQNSNIPQ
ncbi:hypothetical protein SKAU_G00156870 [Synaphobranchus kaupii]|uniref:Uncharacterized protein n=1 Tax=Synaphobranchus kaupii TaxID=118154 RepID=A0A9Q1IZI3_SYNKA|nr:hypothetical protein SKAU_G00156870 [Synaphobranchus kaupii]